VTDPEKNPALAGDEPRPERPALTRDQFTNDRSYWLATGDPAYHPLGANSPQAIQISHPVDLDDPELFAQIVEYAGAWQAADAEWFGPRWMLALSAKVVELRAALAALGDTVPREQHVGTVDERAAWEYVAHKAERERDEARAERDALANQLTSALAAESLEEAYEELSRNRDELDGVMALHDAEVWERGRTAGASIAMRRMSDEPNAPDPVNPYRAAAAGESDRG
jgi:hypothetical protein